jgi:hypothetical protein
MKLLLMNGMWEKKGKKKNVYKNEIKVKKKS